MVFARCFCRSNVSFMSASLIRSIFGKTTSSMRDAKRSGHVRKGVVFYLASVVSAPTSNIASQEPRIG